MNKLLQDIEGASLDRQEDIISTVMKEKWDRELKSKWNKKLSSEYNLNRSTSAGRIVIMNILKWSAVAATLLVLVVAVYNQSGTNPMKLSTKYVAETYIEHPGLTKGIGDADVENRSLAIESYRTKDYKKAAIQFESITNPSQEDRFYTGLSYLYQGDYPKAIEEFELLEKNLPNRFEEEVNWFIALAYVLAEDFDAANLRLELINEGDWKYEESLKLQLTIDKKQ